ncbi:MAG: Dna2/Cas4 domain-containing protein [Saprospiraceae bacterium]|nr:Dna2/Cas4 domain-containing protein [Saprospiraceae bacterium]
MTITATHINYFHICHEKLWLFANGINIEQSFYFVNPYRFLKHIRIKSKCAPMSKQILKQLISKMSPSEMSEFILDIYTNSKHCREYIDHFINPEKGKDVLEKYKKLILKEFYPNNPSNANLNFSIAKKVIKDFAALQPDPIYLGELMMYLPELACKYTNDHGDMYSMYYTKTESCFSEALFYISKHGILTTFNEHAKRCFTELAQVWLWLS